MVFVLPERRVYGDWGGIESVRGAAAKVAFMVVVGDASKFPRIGAAVGGLGLSIKLARHFGRAADDERR
jgi:hypothetical protein